MSFVKSSTTTYYVKSKRYDLYGTPCIPTGQVREVAGERQAEFLCFMQAGDKRNVWLSKDQIM